MHVPISNACVILQCMCGSPTHFQFSYACVILAAARLAHVFMVDVRRPRMLPHVHATILQGCMQKITDWRELEQGLGMQMIQGKNCHECQYGRWA